MQAMGLAALLVLCAAAGTAADVQDKARPVTKVVNLLKDMVTQMQKEAEEDEDIYESMGCWCETNDKLKTTAIADGKSRIDTLTATIEECTANSARLTTEISNLKKEVSKSQQAVDTATALRDKEKAEFVASEKDLLQSITSLKGAVISLSKHNKGAALLQDRDTIDVLTTVSSQMKLHPDLLRDRITPRQREVIKALVQQKQTMAYAPQSNEIFGILQAMKESFEQNLATSQKNEAGAQTAYEGLKESKEEEIAAGQDQISQKTEELAATDEKGAASKQDLGDTEATLAADIKFLADLKDKCANADQEYEERTKMRNLEMTAVSKALEYLASDDAHELFGKTFNPSLLQARRQSRRADRNRAGVVQLLRKAAAISHDPQMSALAVRARMDAFGSLKKTIQTMVDRLLKEKDDEVKHKDFCVEQFNENSRETDLATTQKEETEAKIEDLKMTVDALAKAIEELKAEVAELQDQMKKAGQDREKANKDFQVVVADQRATQKLITTALGVLKGFYEKAALVQVRAHGGQAPPEGFKAYEKSKSSGGVMGMMEGIIKDAKEMEAEAVRGEESSQKAYEDFVMDTNSEVGVLEANIADKSTIKGKTEASQLDAEVDLDKIMQSLDQLATEAIDIHRSCDFLLKNWEVRTSARDQEIEALKQAIALFSGAKMDALLQGLGA